MTSTKTAPVDGPATQEPTGTPLARRLLAANSAWTFAILVALVAFFAIASPPGTFLSQYNITQIATNAAIYLVLGVGMTYVIITGGIDLSNGSVLILSGILAAEFIVHHGGYRAGWPVILVGILISMATGTAWGVLQGVLVAKAKVPPFIVTLGGFGGATGQGMSAAQVGLDDEGSLGRAVFRQGFAQVGDLAQLGSAGAPDTVGGPEAFEQRSRQARTDAGDQVDRQ